MTKVCTTCDVAKPSTQEYFYHQRSQRDGFQSECKECHNSRGEKRSKKEMNRQSRDSKRRLRYEVLTHYCNGIPKCACCGESHVEFLALDHIHGGGNKHRKEISAFGSEFYSWLKNNGWPNDPPLQILCHNCNLAKGFYGTCPHQKQAEDFRMVQDRFV